MPYRRLPKTDSARLKALNTVLDRSKMDGIYSTIVSQKSQHDAETILRKYEQVLYEYKQANDRFATSNKKTQQLSQKARLYVSHFIQVLNMCVIRGEFQAQCKELYSLEPNSSKVPDLSSDIKLVEWGNKIIKGEMQRQQHGGVPIYNPNIAKVRVFFDPFASQVEEQKIQRNSVIRYQTDVTKTREAVDEILCDIWNQVEQAFSDLEPEESLEKCKEYGLVYYYRREEKKKLFGEDYVDDGEEFDDEEEDETLVEIDKKPTYEMGTLDLKF